MDEEKKLQEQQRVDAINKLAEKFAGKVKGVDLKDTAELYITGNKSEKDFSDLIMQNLEKQSAVNTPDVVLTPREVKTYSIARAMRSLISGEKCFEREISSDLEKVFGRAQGILIPHSILDAKRDLLAGTATAAAELVGTDHLAGEFIELLRNKMVFSGLGVRMLSGLKGNVEIPKWNTASTFGWAATEAANTSESTPATTEVTMSPKRGGAYVEASKTLLLQSSPSAESLIVDDLTKVIALAIDKAIAHGSNANGQPKGIIASSPGSFSGASFSWATALEAIADIETANADVPNMAFVSNPAARATLKARAKEAGYPVYIVGDDNTMAGYNYAATNQIESGYMLFGDYSQVILGMWGALDLVVDPYNKAEYGLVRFIAQQLVDVAVRHASAFTVCSDFS